MREGRNFPFAQVGDWVMVSDIPKLSKLLYAILRAHVNASRERAEGDSLVWPSQQTLADLMGVKDRNQVRTHTKPLIEIGAVEVELYRYHNGMRQGLCYTVHLAPPPGHQGPSSLADWYAQRDKSRAADQGESKKAQVGTVAGKIQPPEAGKIQHRETGKTLRPDAGKIQHEEDEGSNKTNRKKNGTSVPPNRRRRTTSPPAGAGSAAVRPVGQERLELESVTWSRAARGVLESVRWLWDGPSATAGRLADLGNLVDELVADGASAAALQDALAALTAGVSPGEVRDGYVWLCLYGLPAAAGRPVDPCVRPDCRYGFLEGQEGDQETARPCPACKTKQGAHPAAKPGKLTLVDTLAVPPARSAGPDLTELRASLATTRTSG